MRRYTVVVAGQTVNLLPNGSGGSTPSRRTSFNQKKKYMNQGHILGRKRNRLNRCRKRLSCKELTAIQRSQIEQRAAALELELKK